MLGAIKKHRNKNDYCLVDGGLWIRNFTKSSVKEIDINNLITSNDMELMLNNEIQNHQKILQKIETESFNHPNIIIISSGFKFEEEQHLLESLKDNTIVIGVNETLDKWNVPVKMFYYVINNPYEECLNFIPKNQKVWPRYICSSRTNPKFIEKTKGLIYTYAPVCDENYSGLKSEADYYIDDYRNPIAAAICLAYKFNVEKLMLLFSDEIYEEQRPATVEISKGIWTYPQQKIAHSIIDGNLHWLKTKEIKISYYPKCIEYKNAEYIDKEGLKDFFK
jgi:hypothetical protein